MQSCLSSMFQSNSSNKFHPFDEKTLQCVLERHSWFLKLWTTICWKSSPNDLLFQQARSLKLDLFLESSGLQLPNGWRMEKEKLSMFIELGRLIK